MSRSVISRIGPRRRVAVLASAGALAAAGALALTGATSAGAATGCSNATLNGTYTFATVGSTVTGGTATSGGTSIPSSDSGFDTFNGAGASTGVITVASNGVIVNNNTPDASTYTINADCTGTEVYTAGITGHFNLYVSPDGKFFSVIETDRGSVTATTETRVGS